MKKDKAASFASTQEYFIKYSSKTSGRQLFETEHKDDINAMATDRRRAASLDNSHHAAHYQTVLKEMWEAEEDQEEYESRAEECGQDIYR